jgi:hypothetical protein
MPKRTAIEPDLIYKTYLETNNGREVARRLGIHENTVYQVLKRFNGGCRSCSNPIKLGEIHCSDCKSKNTERTKKKRAEAKRSGICVSCNEPRMIGNRLYCQACLIKHNIRNENYHNRQKAKTPTGNTANKQQSLRYIQSHYGIEAAKLWDKLDGVCMVCSVKHGEDKNVVHIHHIDGDNKNGSCENIALLCFECHMLTEKLIKHRKPKAILHWIETTYKIG